jgi:hypothetical protein
VTSQHAQHDQCLRPLPTAAGDEDFEIYGEEGGEESPGGLSEGATTSGGETDATSATSDAGMSGEEDEEGDLGF